jgi:beta-glucosidase
MDTNTAGASVTSAGVLTAARTGHVRVTVTATSAGVQTSESALVTITPKCRFGGEGPPLAGDGSPPGAYE